MNHTNCRVTPNFINFLNKMRINRIKVGASDKVESNSDLAEIIIKYFKLDSVSYNKMLEVKNG
jgi:hypothetical protein